MEKQLRRRRAQRDVNTEWDNSRRSWDGGERERQFPVFLLLEEKRKNRWWQKDDRKEECEFKYIRCSDNTNTNLLCGKEKSKRLREDCRENYLLLEFLCLSLQSWSYTSWHKFAKTLAPVKTDKHTAYRHNTHMSRMWKLLPVLPVPQVKSVKLICRCCSCPEC